MESTIGGTRRHLVDVSKGLRAVGAEVHVVAAALLPVGPRLGMCFGQYGYRYLGVVEREMLGGLLEKCTRQGETHIMMKPSTDLSLVGLMKL